MQRSDSILWKQPYAAACHVVFLLDVPSSTGERFISLICRQTLMSTQKVAASRKAMAFILS
jgi:hypothetical protein